MEEVEHLSDLEVHVRGRDLSLGHALKLSLHRGSLPSELEDLPLEFLMRRPRGLKQLNQSRGTVLALELILKPKDHEEELQDDLVDPLFNASFQLAGLRIRGNLDVPLVALTRCLNLSLDLLLDDVF